MIPVHGPHESLGMGTQMSDHMTIYLKTDKHYPGGSQGAGRANEDRHQ